MESLTGGELLFFLIAMMVKIGFVLTITVGLNVYAMVWLERKLAAKIQDRVGPNRVGPIGLLQPLADVVKFIFKEDFEPAQAHKVLFFLAPVITMIPAFMSFAVIPFGPPTTLGGLLSKPVPLQIATLDIGVLYVLAITSLSVYGIMLAGWASNNTFSVMGALRASAQMISYEIAMGLAIVPVVMLAGSTDLAVIIREQSALWFAAPALLSLVIFVPAAFAETNRLPFDLPESEAELVAGYHTEYSSMRFAAFFMAEYANMVTASAMIVTLFFGGWELFPMLTWTQAGVDTDRYFFLPVLWFGLKIGFFMFLYVWVRWTFPRLRYDQLMKFGWGRLVPLGLVNILLVALGMYAGIANR